MRKREGQFSYGMWYENERRLIHTNGFEFFERALKQEARDLYNELMKSIKEGDVLDKLYEIAIRARMIGELFQIYDEGGRKALRRHLRFQNEIHRKDDVV